VTVASNAQIYDYILYHRKTNPLMPRDDFLDQQ